MCYWWDGVCHQYIGDDDGCYWSADELKQLMLSLSPWPVLCTYCLIYLNDRHVLAVSGTAENPLLMPHIYFILHNGFQSISCNLNPTCFGVCNFCRTEQNWIADKYMLCFLLFFLTNLLFFLLCFFILWLLY